MHMLLLIPLFPSIGFSSESHNPGAIRPVGLFRPDRAAALKRPNCLPISRFQGAIWVISMKVLTALCFSAGLLVAGAGAASADVKLHSRGQPIQADDAGRYISNTLGKPSTKWRWFWKTAKVGKYAVMGASSVTGAGLLVLACDFGCGPTYRYLTEDGS